MRQRMNASCHTYASRESVVFHTCKHNGGILICDTHMSHINESRHAYGSYQWVMTHILVNSYVTHLQAQWQHPQVVTMAGGCELGTLVRGMSPSHTYIRMSHVPYEWRNLHLVYKWVISYMNESCPIWMSHVIYEWVMSYMNESYHIWMSHVPYEWVMSHINESCPIWMEASAGGVWMSRVPYERVMSHMNVSCPIYMEASAGGGDGGGLWVRDLSSWDVA